MTVLVYVISVPAVIVFSVRVAMTMIVFVKPFRQFLTLIQQMSLLICDLILQLRNLNLNLFQSRLHSFFSHNAQSIQRGNQIVIRQPKLSVVSRIASRPIKLLRIHLNSDGIISCLTSHFIPSP